MSFQAASRSRGAKIDVAFVGSCTNGRLSDLRIAAEVAKKGKVAKHVRALIVPGLSAGREGREAEGLHEIFQSAGFEWRKAGCSMCLGMNPDQLVRARDERVVQQPQLHRPSGQPDRAHAADEPRHGRRGRDHGAVADVREILDEPLDFKRTPDRGRGIPVTGNDIDTDRIIPARFLKEVTFETDGRARLRGREEAEPEHPFNSPAYKGASVLGRRPELRLRLFAEHAPQALMRWGIAPSSAAPSARSSSATA
jgi:hypothetical protein